VYAIDLETYNGKDSTEFLLALVVRDAERVPQAEKTGLFRREKRVIRWVVREMGIWVMTESVVNVREKARNVLDVDSDP